MLQKNVLGMFSGEVSDKSVTLNSDPYFSSSFFYNEHSQIIRKVEEFWSKLSKSTHPIFNRWVGTLKQVPLNNQNITRWNVSLSDFLFTVSLSSKGRSALFDWLRVTKPINTDICVCPVRFKGLLPRGSTIIRELRDIPRFLDKLSAEVAYLWLRSVADSAVHKEDQSQQVRKLSLLTFNVCGLPKPLGTMDSRPKRFFEIGRQIRAMSPDIIGLQEMWETNSTLVLRASQYQHRFSDLEVEHLKRKSLIGRSGLALASKYPMNDCELLSFSSTSGLERMVSKGAVYARIETPDGLVDVYNVHLTSEPERLNKLFISDSYSHQIRALQLRELKDWITRRTKPGIPVYVMGDFNFSEDDNLYRTARRFLGDDLFRLRYGFPQSTESPEIEDDIFGATFDPFQNKFAKSPKAISERLDYIWCNQQDEANHLYAAKRVFTENPLSDHFGVLITVQEEL